MRDFDIEDSVVAEIVDGSDAVATRALYRALDATGTHGEIAHLLLATWKNSSRAKAFRSYSDRYYETKGAHLTALAHKLATADLTWGWGEDCNGFLKWVIYVDLPTGQVSFHAEERGDGPDYPKQWDGVRFVSGERIVAWAQSLIPNWQYARPVMDNAELRERRSAAETWNSVLITGNTYPVKDALRAIGGRWDAKAKGWRVPTEKADEARRLVDDSSGRKSNGATTDCGSVQ